jgi:hypothetical protein
MGSKYMNHQERKDCCPQSERCSFEGNEDGWEEGKVCPSRERQVVLPAMV